MTNAVSSGLPVGHCLWVTGGPTVQMEFRRLGKKPVGRVIFGATDDWATS